MASTKDLLQNAVTGVLVLCALTVIGLVVRRQFLPSAAEAAVTEVEEWKPLALVGNRMGPAQPEVSVVEFSDFQCPYCARAHQELAEVRKKHPGVAVVYRHLPLNGHAQAVPAAVASECAAEQGAFEAYSDLLFRNQDSIGVTGWDEFARRSGVRDVERFRACLTGDAARERVERDRAAATRLGARGTPTFVVNGKMFSGSVPPGGWDRWIEEARSAR